jgi:hypothetical protein
VGNGLNAIAVVRLETLRWQASSNRIFIARNIRERHKTFVEAATRLASEGSQDH